MRIISRWIPVLLRATVALLLAAVCRGPGAVAQDPARPDLVVPLNYSVKFQLKNKGPIRETRTFDNKVVEIKDVLDDPTSLLIRGIGEGYALLEVVSKSGERQDVRVLVIRQQTPTTNLELARKSTYNFDHLEKTVKKVAPGVEVYPLTTDSVYVYGEVLTLRDIEIILRLASKVVDPGYLENDKKGAVYSYKATLKRGGIPAAGQPGTPGGGEEQVQFDVSVKVVSGLRVKGELTSMTEKMARLEEMIQQVAPKAKVRAQWSGSDSVLLQGKVESADQLRKILEVASKVIDPDFSTTGDRISPKVVNHLEVDNSSQLSVTQPGTTFDITHLKNLIRKAVPNSNVEIVPITRESVILSGFVSRAEDVQLILHIANNIVDPNYLSGPQTQGASAGQPGLGTPQPTDSSSTPALVSPGTTATNTVSPRIVNALRVAGVQQVQLDVVVAQVSRSEFRHLGFNFLASRNAFFLGSTLGNLASSPVGVGGVVTSSGSSTGSILSANGLIASATTLPNVPFGVLNSNSGFLGFLQALRNENASKLLAEPKLVTSSGRPAYFLVGGRQAVLSGTSGVNGPGAAFQEVGTDLRFLPVVLGNGKIHLAVQPRVRSVNNALGITTSFGFVPGFDEKQVDTSVELEVGQTLVLGGLIQNEIQGITNKVPVLGDIPFLGAFFSTKSFNEIEQEVVVLVTPHLVDSMSSEQAAKPLPGQETRSPDDFELFLEGILEAPRGPRKVMQHRRYIPAFRNAPPLDSEAGESRVPGNLQFPNFSQGKAQDSPKTIVSQPGKEAGIALETSRLSPPAGLDSLKKSLNQAATPNQPK